jgi:hypothetical protein
VQPIASVSAVAANDDGRCATLKIQTNEFEFIDALQWTTSRFCVLPNGSSLLRRRQVNR